MTRGRKPTPRSLRVLRGNPGKRPLPPRARTAPHVPTCPAELSDEAKKEWRRLTKELAAAGLLTRMDREALALLCAAYARWVEAEAAIRKYGLVIKSPSGFPMQSPYLAIANKALDQVRLLLAEFGMSPSSRTRVQVAPQKDEDDPLETLLRRRREMDARGA